MTKWDLSHEFKVDLNTQQSRNRKEIPQPDKEYAWNTHSLHYGERLKCFPRETGTTQICPFSPLLFNTVLQDLASTIRQEKRNERHPNLRERSKFPLFTENMTVENQMKSTIKLLELVC